MFGSAMPAAVGSHAALASCVTTNAGELVCTSSSLSGGAIAFLVVLGLIYLGLIVLFIAAYVKIVTKAGYSGWWVLIGLVPVVGLVMFLVFAFSDWPALRELKRLRAQEGYRGGVGQQGWYPGGPGSWGGGEPWGAGPWAGGPGGFGPQGSFGPTAPGTGTDAAPAQGPGTSGSPATEAGLPPFGRTGSVAPATAGGEGPVAPAITGGEGPVAGGGGSVAAAAAPAGWYPTPDGRRRYWDGTAWTDHFA
jgi:hypothetical protein